MSHSSSDSPPISRIELVGMMAMMMATVAFSIDAMLPLLPEIAADTATAGSNQIGLVITVFLVGMGFGTLFVGPLSDAYGRHPIALGGAVLYILGALYSAYAETLETLLIARAIQGIGAAGPRIVAQAIIRDLYSGRQMAQMVSFVMTVFALVPVLAPSFGALIGWAFGWRAIFICFAIFAVISIVWLKLRLPETLGEDSKRAFRVGRIGSGIVEVMRTPTVLPAILAQALVYAVLFGVLMTSQPVIDVVFGRGDTFYFWFGVVSALSAAASMLNARIVIRLGMTRVVRTSLFGLILYSSAYLASLAVLGTASVTSFVVFLFLLVYAFALAALCIGNLNAIAMIPLGHMAGLATSIISAVSTIAGSLLAVPMAVAFDGTPMPLVTGVLLSALLARLIAQKLPETD